MQIDLNTVGTQLNPVLYFRDFPIIRIAFTTFFIPQT